MFERLDKYRAELERAYKRRAELDAKIKELERRCKEEENAQIHGMVHAMNMTPEQLQALLDQVAAGNLPGAAKSEESRVDASADDYDDEEMEDFEDDEN